MIKQRIVEMFKKINLDISVDSINKPKNPEHGDIACSIAFKLAKELKKKPIDIAKELVEQIEQNGLDSLFSEVSAIGPFINFRYSQEEFAKLLIDSIIKEDTEKINPENDKKPKYLVEFYQPNSFKSVHIGHVRNGALGESVSRILRYAGAEVTQVLYLGDIGTHVARWLWFFTKYPNKVKEIQKNKPSHWIGEVYAESTRAIRAENAEDEVRETHKKLEARDPKLYVIWEQYDRESREEIFKIAKELDLHYEKVYYESEVQESGKKLVQRLLNDGIAIMSEGAPIIDFKERGIKLSNFLLMKSDGSSLYATKDLALAYKKLEDYEFDISLYVVGTDQKDYLKQLHKTLEIMGYPKKNIHLDYDLVNLVGGEKMSSREGTVILYREVQEAMYKHILEEVKKRNPDITEELKKDTVEKIVFGAMKFSMLNRSIQKDIKFDYKEAMNFNGKTGTYLQYTALRAKKIIEKVELKKLKIESKKANYKKLLKTDIELLKQMAEIETIITSAAKKYDPVGITEYVFDLSQIFNVFYSERNIINEADIGTQMALLMIVKAFIITIQNLLYLLGIEIPEVM